VCTYVGKKRREGRKGGGMTETYNVTTDRIPCCIMWNPGSIRQLPVKLADDGESVIDKVRCELHTWDLRSATAASQSPWFMLIL
jgi:hypothetical protein